MTPEIRGTTDESTQMLLGQIREVFDPDWIQGFGSRKFTVQFREEPDAREELINFLNMYGYELQSEKDLNWKHYHFE